jgi:hypothetical protein
VVKEEFLNKTSSQDKKKLHRRDTHNRTINNTIITRYASQPQQKNAKLDYP